MIVLFYIFAALAVIAAVGVLISRQPLHSALCMLGTMVCLAVIFLLNHADFIAAVQIAVYAGAVMMLVIFVIFLIDLGQEADRKRANAFLGIGVLTGLMVFGVLAAFVRAPFTGRGDMSEAALLKQGSVEFLADKLFGPYLLPFEVASVLLLVGLVGAVALAKKKL
jgi:NADH-quinone oxidoreductase subunit J